MIYQLFIEPLQSLFAWLFDLFYQLTNNYGVAIILLSAIVNLLLWPLYLLAERLKESERREKTVMAAELNNIADYGGAEKHYYRNYIYRRHGYHPLKSLRVSAGLLIQLPFFIASYQFLSHYDGFSGTGFLFIADLAQPDGLLAGINLLPVVMTLLNLAAAACYSAGMEKSDRYQLYALSGLFLFLLYDQAAALVFYWTLNNLIALAKALSKLKDKKIILTALARKIKNPARRTKEVAAEIWLMLPAVSFYLGLRYLQTPSASRGSEASALLLLLIVFLALLSLLIDNLLWPEPENKKLLSVLVLRLCYFAVILLFIEYFFAVFGLDNAKRSKELIVLFIAIALLVKIIGRRRRCLAILGKLTGHSSNAQNFRQKILLIGSLILFLTLSTPIAWIIASSPGEFANHRWLFVKTCSLLLAVSLFYFGLLVLLARFNHRFSYLALFLTDTILLINLFVLVGNYGKMDFFIFHIPQNLQITGRDWMLETIILFVSLGAAWQISKKITFRPLFLAMTMFLATLIIATLPYVYTIFSYTGKISAAGDNNNNNNGKKIDGEPYSLLDNSEPVFFFSQNNNNVLLIFYDRFIGGFIPDILADQPQLKDKLTGFVWYPNTLSFGNDTFYGLPPIHQGYGEATDVDYRRDKGKISWPTDSPSVTEQFNKSYRYLTQKFLDSGYQTILTDPSFLGGKWYGDISVAGLWGRQSRAENLIGKYLSLYLSAFNMENLRLNDQSETELIRNYLLPFALFKTLFPSVRSHLYNGGGWWNPGQVGTGGGWVRSYLKNLSLAYMYPYISRTGQQLPGQFIFTTNNMTHEPYAARDNGTFAQSAAAEADYSDISQQALRRFHDKTTAVHFFAAKEALIRAAVWFDWLKENNVYDNTLIVIVSDHGREGIYDPMFGDNQDSADGFHYGAYHPLLMVKKIDATGDLQTDNSFMTNADVPAITLSVLEPAAQQKYGYDKSQGFRLYTDTGNLTVYDNIFAPTNWVYSAKD